MKCVLAAIPVEAEELGMEAQCLAGLAGSDDDSVTRAAEAGRHGWDGTGLRHEAHLHCRRRFQNGVRVVGHHGLVPLGLTLVVMRREGWDTVQGLPHTLQQRTATRPKFELGE